MIIITEHNTLNMNNLISFRSTLNQQGVFQAMKEIDMIVSESKTERNGSVVTTTYSSKMENGEMVMDVEILYPVLQKIDLPSGYNFKPVFHLCNTVKMRYQGSPMKAQEAMKEFMLYITEHNLKLITSIYTVIAYEPKSKEEFENYTVEVYVGISENIL